MTDFFYKIVTLEFLTYSEPLKKGSTKFNCRVLGDVTLQGVYY